MQQHVKFLVVEDEPEWSASITEEVRSYFEDSCGLYKARILDDSAVNGDQGLQRLKAGTYDLVTLDMNLCASGSKSKISGLDLLARIADGNRAYFVIIITGAVNDPTLDRFYGKETAAIMRYGALNEAVMRLPAERVRILHKPAHKNTGHALEELKPHLKSALDQYCAVSRERNIFRPVPGDPKQWEVRFNGGPRLTLKTESPYRTLQSALAQPGRSLEVNRLMQSLAQSSGRAGATRLAGDDEAGARKNIRSTKEYQGYQEDEVSGEEGLDWAEMPGFSVTDTIYSPVDLAEGTIPIESIIGILLETKRSGKRLADAVDILVKHGIEEKALLGIPRASYQWAKKGHNADIEFGCDNAPAELHSLIGALKPVLEPIKQRWLEGKNAEINSQEPKKQKKTSAARVAQGNDTAEMRLARQHKKRFLAKMHARPALRDFCEHMKNWIPPDPTTRGHLFYRPPDGGELYPFWLTE